jgi:1,2-dihydroxy-3-keto-5-methylthiopentene dioxygenase
MITLTIFPEDRPEAGTVFMDRDEIAARLTEVGVTLERWEANRTLPPDASDDEVIAAYRDSVDRLMREHGFHSVDVVSMHPNHAKRAELRQKFLDEHVHSDFEVRFFVEGRSMFYIHAAGRVYATLCEQGDLISIPADTRHWFDMGEHPSFRCIRLFTTPDGWVASFTGDPIARRFPSFDALVPEAA